ncbi:hypothetical protein [Novosphingobium sp. ST904]|uniref:hypothetical protein n=1 Tax=Novosphingobium sp. ST904 TaxID=1684385 RepID=UPI0006C84435|nr:hypothetical protein [Novosphingobium sp. ST904]KPH67546.1 hypothetical protein ADT71_02275 [Novosphingobium sp. ST904]TCM30051.1 hypothetical protein EDF59_12778 [Novosphingobium sp. ST904]
MIPVLRVSGHAIQRYQERVANVSADEARAALSTPVIQAAANFGARFVRLGTGHRVCIQNHVVLSVLPAEHYRRQVRRYGLGRYGRGELPASYFEGN